jgi:hypothetical protein
MNHPHPRPSDRLAPDRRAPDLQAAEAETQRWFDALPRAAAPAFDAEAALLPACGVRSAAGTWLRPLAAAAAVLVALALPAQEGVRRAAPASAGAQHFAVAVVDDPSVPMLHGVETFDQLALLTDVSGGFGAGAPGGR